MADVGLRYTGSNGTGQLLPPNSTQTQGPSSSTASGSTSGTTNSTANSNTSRDATTNTTQQNMSPQSIAALNLLIQQLMGGGTQSMAEDKARKLQEEQALQQQLQGYSKGNAFGDAQGAMAQQLRMVMEKIAPNLVRAAEGAGTSQNSMRALLLQQGANQAAESSSALGLKAAVDYGNISNGLSGILSNLVNQADPTTTALLNALNIAKGSVSNMQSTVHETGTGTNTSTGTTSGTTTQETDNSPKTTTTTYQPSGLMGSFSGNSNTNLGAPPQSFLNTNQNLLDLLSGNNAYTNNYTF